MPVPLFVLVSSSSARVHSCLYLDCQFLREGFDLLRFLPKFSPTGDLKGLQTVKNLSRFYCCDEGHTGIARPKAVYFYQYFAVVLRRAMQNVAKHHSR